MRQLIFAKSVFFIFLFSLSTFSQAQVMVNLKTSLKLARQQNPDLKTSAYNMDISRANITTSRLRPNLLFNTQLLGIANPAARVDNSTSIFNPANTQTWYQVTKPFRWQSQRSGMMDLADKLLEQSSLDYQESSRNVFYNVANQWLNVWQSHSNLDILLKGKVYIDSLVMINEVRFRDQDITSTDLMRVHLLQEQYKRAIVNERQNYYNELQNLKYLLASPDSLLIDMNDNTFNSIKTAGDSLMKLGLESRTDILSAKNAIDVSQSNISLQKALAYPVPELGMIWNPQNTIHYIGIYGTIQIPIFNRNQGERQKSEVLKLQNEQALKATQAQVETEVNTAYRTYMVQRDNIVQYENNLKTAEDILTNIRYAYFRGGTTIIDFLEAQRSWLDTQQQYYNALGDFKRSYIQLLFATGLINQIAE
jgi:cobalt-zinc-cadmium efflux system outer membrane protein